MSIHCESLGFTSIISSSLVENPYQSESFSSEVNMMAFTQLPKISQESKLKGGGGGVRFA